MQVPVKLTIDLSQLDKTVGELIAKIEDKPRLLTVIGEGLLLATQEHFADEESPDGKAWKPHSPLTQALRAGKGSSILRASGRLLGSIHYTVYGSSVVLEPAPLPYAGIHQRGGIIKPVNGKALAIPFKAGFMGKDGKKSNRGGVIFLAQVRIEARPYIGWGRKEDLYVREGLESWLMG